MEGAILRRELRRKSIQLRTLPQSDVLDFKVRDVRYDIVSPRSFQLSGLEINTKATPFPH